MIIWLSGSVTAIAVVFCYGAKELYSDWRSRYCGRGVVIEEEEYSVLLLTKYTWVERAMSLSISQCFLNNFISTSQGQRHNEDFLFVFVPVAAPRVDSLLPNGSSGFHGSLLWLAITSTTSLIYTLGLLDVWQQTTSESEQEECLFGTSSSVRIVLYYVTQLKA